MLVNGIHLCYQVNVKGEVNTDREGSEVKLLVKIGNSDDDLHAALAIYKDDVALYINFSDRLVYTNDKAFAETLECQSLR